MIKVNKKKFNNVERTKKHENFWQINFKKLTFNCTR